MALARKQVQSRDVGPIAPGYRALAEAAGTLARVLPDDVRGLHRESQLRRDLREDLRSEPHFPESASWLEQAGERASVYKSACDEHREWLAHLLGRLATDLPGLYPKLRRAAEEPLGSAGFDLDRLVDVLYEVEAAALAREAGRGLPADPGTITVDVEKVRATLDGVVYPLATKRQAEVLRSIVEAEGRWVGSEIRQDADERIERIVKRLPAPIRERIERKAGSGHRLLPPP